MKFGIFCIVAAATAFCWRADSVCAAPRERLLLDLRREFVRLRNTDPSTEDRGTRPLWKKLGQQYVSALDSGEGNQGSALEMTSRVDGATLFFRLYGVERERELLDQAASLLSKVAPPDTRARNDELALLLQEVVLRGDVAVAQGEDESAKEWYLAAQELASGAGGGENPADGRLTSLRNGTFSEFLPAPELERPRIVPTKRRRAQKNGKKPIRVVVLDPGHGGDDSGAVGSMGLFEKDVTLEIARLVEEELRGEEGVRVTLTRTDDEFVPLARRTQYANHQEANVFVSLHNNASPSHKLEGFETYYLDNTDDQAGKKLAERENSERSDGELNDIDFMLSDLIQSGKLEDSIRFASLLDREIVGAGASFGARSKGVKRAPFFVLVGAHMPCVLVELLFIDNEADAGRLASKRFKMSIARAIADGILKFVKRG